MKTKLLLIVCLCLGAIMTVTAEGPISLPFANLAELASLSERWQALNDVDTPAEALPMIRYPRYEVLNEGNLIDVPLIVISNPIDLPLTLVKPLGMQQNQRNNGALLLTIILPEDTSITVTGDDETQEDQRFLKYCNDVGIVLKQMLQTSESERPDPADGYYMNVLYFEQAIAAGKCSPNKLAAKLRGSSTPADDDPPVLVYSSSWICHWM